MRKVACHSLRHVLGGQFTLIPRTLLNQGRVSLCHGADVIGGTKEFGSFVKGNVAVWLSEGKCRRVAE